MQTFQTSGFSPVEELRGHPAEPVPVMVLLRIQETVTGQRQQLISEQTSYQYSSGLFFGDGLFELNGFGKQAWDSGHLTIDRTEGPYMCRQTAELAAFCRIPPEMAIRRVGKPRGGEGLPHGLGAAV